VAWGLAALLGLSPSVAFGWGDGGHEIVAAIAYSRLNDRAKAEADRLLAVPVSPAGRPEPSDPAKRFMHAAHWADDVKPMLPDTADEHFIDQPFSPDGTTLPGDLPKSDNIVVALKWYVLTLRIGSNDSEKARALRFVIHFVGDIHQPLHCSTRVTRALPEGDRGGNDFIRYLTGIPTAMCRLPPGVLSTTRAGQPKARIWGYIPPTAISSPMVRSRAPTRVRASKPRDGGWPGLGIAGPIC
jgi:hypothetical protein